MLATAIESRASRVPPVGLLTRAISLLSWLAVIVSSHECKLLSLYGRKTADCDNLSLKSIPNDLEHDIQILLFRDNEITYLGMDEFTNYRALQQIRMVRNRIDMIAPDAFRYLYNLQVLDLEGNKITNIPPSVFQHLTSVRIVNMKSNPLVFLTKDALSHLKNVEELNFENCWLERIHPQAFKGLNKLYELNLVNNELKVLDADMQHYLPRSLKVLRIHRNPWNCDCKLRWLREYVQSRKIQWNFYSNVPVCDLPELIHDIAWNNLDPDRFACAARIVTAKNMSTSIELEVRGNVTINCVVQGDPRPTVTWMKGSRFVHPAKISERQCTADDGTVQFCSSLTFNDLQPSDEGDYRCIAKNYAGRSEITYKLWVHDPSGGMASLTLYGLTTETLIGIGIGAGVLVLLIVASVVWTIRRQNNGRKQPYKIRNYKKPAQNNHENHSPMKKNKEPYEVADDEQPAIAEAKDKDKASTQIADNCQLVLINHKSPESATVPSPVLENHLNAAKNKEFKMTIFKGDQTAADDRGDADKPIGAVDGASGTGSSVVDGSKANGSKAETTTAIESSVPPDVVQRTDGSKMPCHKAVASPTSPPSVPNHVQSQGHRRAEENPYAKPSEMKPTKQKTGSRTDRKADEKALDAKTKTPAPPPQSTETAFGESTPTVTAVQTSGPDKKKVTTFSVETPTCKNPVCLKEHPGDGPRAKSPIKTKEISEKDAPALGTTKQHIKGSKSMSSGLNDSPPEKAPGGGTRSPPGVRLPAASDRYRTLPAQPKVVVQTDGTKTYGSYGRGQTPRPAHETAYGLGPSSRQSLGHYGLTSAAGHGAETSRLAKLPAQRQPPTATRSQYHEPQIHGFQPSLPPDPIPAHLRSKSLTPRTTPPGGHGAERPISSPTRKLTKTFEATSLDDLLSPPFGHITVDKQKPARTQTNKLPLPGDKDEYGTAV